MHYTRFKTLAMSIGFITMFSGCSEDGGVNPKNDPIEPEYVAIPDVNFEEQLIEKGIDSDGVVNQKVLASDISEITSLDLTLSKDSGSEKKIKDLAGIEGFTKLKDLNVEGHVLTSIALNENILLDKLNVSSNQITALDLSENRILSHLEAGWNELKEIDISANINLDTLKLQLNYLKTIDLSNNVNLIEANFHFNELTSVVGLESTTKLRSLNLSWNFLEKLTIKLSALEGLNVEQNQLQSLNVDGSTSLKTFIATTNSIESLDLTTNVALETLLLSANNIKSINLTNNKDLGLLWISSNQLTSLDVSSLSKLYDLSVGRNIDLDCIKIGNEQSIPTVRKEERQTLAVDTCP